jgi:hypothetical protein
MSDKQTEYTDFMKFVHDNSHIIYFDVDNKIKIVNLTNIVRYKYPKIVDLCDNNHI